MTLKFNFSRFKSSKLAEPFLKLRQLLICKITNKLMLRGKRLSAYSNNGQTFLSGTRNEEESMKRINSQVIPMYSVVCVL